MATSVVLPMEMVVAVLNGSGSGHSSLGPLHQTTKLHHSALTVYHHAFNLSYIQFPCYLFFLLCVIIYYYFYYFILSIQL